MRQCQGASGLRAIAVTLSLSGTLPGSAFADAFLLQLSGIGVLDELGLGDLELEACAKGRQLQFFSFEFEGVLNAELLLAAPREQLQELFLVAVGATREEEIVNVDDAHCHRLSMLPLVEEHAVEVVLLEVDAQHATHDLFELGSWC